MRPDGVVTLGGALSRTATRLAGAGIDTPLLEAQLLLCHAAGTVRTHLAAHPEDLLTPEQARRLEELTGRRAAREPLPYLVEEAPFLDMQLQVGRGCLIPRPETELLVEETARRLRPGATLLDVGTGSGCIALGLARMIPARVTALEASAEALGWAEKNVRRLDPAGMIQLVSGRFPEQPAGDHRFDAVVSNPPYIPSVQIESLQPEIRDWEPRTAVDGGEDGLCVIESLIAHAGRFLDGGGLLAFEIARNQAHSVRSLLQEYGWAEIELVPDLAGIPRVALARRRSGRFR